ncbi:phospho-sugar mutase [Tepidibacillus infernus]|uniref:phospho-sugar mutase n=1 Tax=Tepidibacillus TaxID=1494427 RepID=UPI0008529ED6|nr:phospho-sugar mutase [Tepidibacillus sp. HK-1]GBF12146.1 phosphoglucomutase [Tepidibacillus sp. HK-1]
MGEVLKQYETWLQYDNLQPELMEELQQIEGNMKEIEERFYKNLEFGTGGLRGIIGAGTNRMNIYTVRKATMGLTNCIIEQGEKAIKQGVVIAYDSRRYSQTFAEESAKVLATHGVQVYLFNELRPTPLLSFAVRHLHAFAGIVITASHNPSEYNGYKVYNTDGNQITEEMAEQIYHQMTNVKDILHISVEPLDQLLEQGLIHYIGKEIDNEYAKNVRSLLLNQDLIAQSGKELSIIYTPLHGTGNKPVREILHQVGFTNLHIVKEQEHPDPNFSTVKAPNPEEREVFHLALQLAKEKNADIIMATDPDADRLGVLVKNGEEYEALNGNQLGAIILYYLLNEKAKKGILPENGVMVNTIVTSDLGEKIASAFHIATEKTLTGFKYIGEKIKEYRETGQYTFLFGYEESYGYLAGDFVRDKDAVQITAIVAEMALVYKLEGKSLLDILDEVYQRFGYYKEDLVSITLKGIEGSNKIKEIVTSFRENPPKELIGMKVKSVEDYLLSPMGLPKSNVLKIIFEDDAWIAIRPSGTEPKLKFYFSMVSNSPLSVQEKLKQLKEAVLAQLT